MPPDSDPRDLLDAVEDSSRELLQFFPRLSNLYVPGEGAYEKPAAFIVGDAPGAQEAIAGRPFMDKAGLVLRQLMEIADLRTTMLYEDGRDSAPTAPRNCWLTNLVKFRAVGNAPSKPEEIKAFRRVLQAEWHAVGQPNLIIPIGSVALRAVTGNPTISILRAAGKCHMHKSRHTGRLNYIWPMVHPRMVMMNDNELLQEIIEKDWERLGKWRAKNGLPG